MQKWEYIKLSVVSDPSDSPLHPYGNKSVHVYRNGDALRLIEDDAGTINPIERLWEFYGYLNKLGMEGWDLVNIHVGVYEEFYYLKRSIG